MDVPQPNPTSNASRRRLDRILARWTLPPATADEWERAQRVGALTNHNAPLNEMAAFIVGRRDRQPTGRSWAIWVCPDCGRTNVHADSCGAFPGLPVVHGNRVVVAPVAAADEHPDALQRPSDQPKETRWA
jgi:hypothetical protein